MRGNKCSVNVDAHAVETGSGGDLAGDLRHGYGSTRSALTLRPSAELYARETVPNYAILCISIRNDVTPISGSVRPSRDLSPMTLKGPQLVLCGGASETAPLVCGVDPAIGRDISVPQLSRIH